VKTSTVVTPNHTHDVEIGTTTTTSEQAHRHELFSGPLPGTVTPDTYFNVYDKDGYPVMRVPCLKVQAVVPWSMPVVDAHSHNVDYGTKTSAAGGGAHSHDVEIGTVTSASGGGAHSHQVSGQTTDTIDDHTHDVNIGTVTSAAGGGAHSHSVSGQTTDTIDDHTHTVNIGTVTSASGGGSHSHQVSGQTTSTVDHHTHDVPIGSHSHEIDFGIYEEDIAGRTLSAKLYDPSGALVKNFGVILTGEGKKVLDLTEYFKELKIGFWRLELTASARLRCRLLFYELCKMYAQY